MHTQPMERSVSDAITFRMDTFSKIAAKFWSLWCFHIFTGFIVDTLQHSKNVIQLLVIIVSIEFPAFRLLNLSFAVTKFTANATIVNTFYKCRTHFPSHDWVVECFCLCLLQRIPNRLPHSIFMGICCSKRQANGEKRRHAKILN